MTTPHPAELTEAERVRLRALADAATPGPWEAPEGDAGWAVMRGGLEVVVEASVSQCDAEFIAATRTAVPALLDALEAAERERGMALRMHDVQFERANRIVAENQRLREGIGVAAETLGAWLDDDGRDEAAAPERAEAELRTLLSTSSVRGEGDG